MGGQDGALVVGVVVLAVVLLVTLVLLARARAALLTARAEVDELTVRLEQARAAPPMPTALGVAERAVRAAVTTVARVRDRGVGGLLVSSIEDLTRWALEDRAEIAKVSAPDGTVAILFSDVEGSTALNEEMGDAAWVRLLEAHDVVVHRAVERHGGHVVKSQGDGFMVVFGAPADAVGAAVALQRALSERPGRRLRRRPIRVRVGIHVGPTITREGDYFGRAVALAARVAGEADGGEVLVTEEVVAGLADTLPDAVTGAGGLLDGVAVRVEERAEVELKGLAGHHRLYAVHWEGDLAPADPRTADGPAVRDEPGDRDWES